MLLEKIRLYSIIVMFALIILFFSLNLCGLICPSELVAHSIGEPLILKRNSDFLCTGISQIVADENHIYILYGQYSVVQVYSLEGKYEYTISVYNHMNGRTQITTLNGCLYLCDKINNIYIFKDGALDEFIDRSNSSQIREHLSFWENSKEYVIHNGSVWYAPNARLAKRVIQRPLWLLVYQNNILFLCLFLSVCIVGLILMSPFCLAKYRNHK